MRLFVLLLLASVASYLVLMVQSPWDMFPGTPPALRPFRPLWLSAVNRALLPYKDWLVPITATDLMLRAKRSTGLDDFYDEPRHTFEHALTRLCHSLNTEAELSFMGRVMTRVQLDVLVENRLKIGAEAAAAAAKGRRTSRITRPIFVAGMPRSGTTFLHNLLSLDEDNFRAPRLWEIVDPLPASVSADDTSFWDRAHFAVRMAKSRAGTAFFRYLAPNFASVHPVDSHNAEECMPILSLSGLSFNFYTMSNVPEYNDWLLDQDQTEALEWHKRFLSVMQQPDDEENKKRAWLLKAPWHMNHLDTLLEVYPDARIIVPHRSPRGMLPSLSSLHARLFAVTSDQVDAVAIGQYTRKTWERIIGRYLNSTATGTTGKIIDVSFEDELKLAPLHAVRRVYEELGLELSRKAEQRMRQWLDTDNKLGKRGASGKHEYEPEWFGLKDDEELTPNLAKYERKMVKHGEDK